MKLFFFKWSYEHDRTRHWTKRGECVDSNLNTSDWPLHCRNQQTRLWLPPPPPPPWGSMWHQWLNRNVMKLWVYFLHHDTLVNMRRRLTQKRRNCWIKSLFLFAHKKYSCSFITLRLNLWCHMDYFNNVLTSFLGLKWVSCIAVYARSESSQISSNIS